MSVTSRGAQQTVPRVGDVVTAKVCGCFATLHSRAPLREVCPHTVQHPCMAYYA